jgi:hypothetical protein
MNRLIRSTASPARAKSEARAKRTARGDKFRPCLFDRACLIEARAEMMENDAERRVARATPAPTARQQPNGASLGQDERQDRRSQRQGGNGTAAAYTSGIRE